VSVAQKLNELLVVPECDGGKVTLERYTDTDYEETRPLNEEELAELAALGVVPDNNGHFGCLDEHPEGSDRGGYVPTLNDSASTFYYEPSGEWQG
jgi:hypothetical protein